MEIEIQLEQVMWTIVHPYSKGNQPERGANTMQAITMYSKDYCPYCKAAKALLRSKGLAFNEIEVGDNERELKTMIARSNRRTVPQIFFGETHIGGYTDLEDYFSNAANSELERRYA